MTSSYAYLLRIPTMHTLVVEIVGTYVVENAMNPRRMVRTMHYIYIYIISRECFEILQYAWIRVPRPIYGYVFFTMRSRARERAPDSQQSSNTIGTYTHLHIYGSEEWRMRASPVLSVHI